MTFLASLAASLAATWLFLRVIEEFPFLTDLIVIAILIGAICYVW